MKTPLFFLFTGIVWSIAFLFGWGSLLLLVTSQEEKILRPPHCMKICERKTEDELWKYVYRW